MHISGKMHGTFAVYRIPSCRISHAEKLCFKSDTDSSFIRFKPDDASRSFPSCAARCAANDFDFRNDSICYPN
jgi:hypothetical protein